MVLVQRRSGETDVGVTKPTMRAIDFGGKNGGWRILGVMVPEGETLQWTLYSRMHSCGTHEREECKGHDHSQVY